MPRYEADWLTVLAEQVQNALDDLKLAGTPITRSAPDFHQFNIDVDPFILDTRDYKVRGGVYLTFPADKDATAEEIPIEPQAQITYKCHFEPHSQMWDFMTLNQDSNAQLSGLLEGSGKRGWTRRGDLSVFVFTVTTADFDAMDVYDATFEAIQEMLSLPEEIMHVYHDNV